MLRRHGLNQRKPGLLLGARVVANTSRNDKHLARTQGHRTAVFFGAANRQRSTQHKKEFVLVRMAMPGKLSLHANRLEILIIHLGQDTRGPKLGQPGTGLFERDRLGEGQVRMGQEEL